MIRKCDEMDVKEIYGIVNDAAQAYNGFIPSDCWHEPYMPMEELLHEIQAGVEFWGYEEGGILLGVMGLQEVDDVSLIRHAYVRTTNRNSGIGGKLIAHLKGLTSKPLLIGTWAAAEWAIIFYEKHGFEVASRADKNRLLKRYWKISDRQVETSVVLAERNNQGGINKMARKAFSAEGAVSVGPYSHAVESGDLIYLSGQTPIDAETGNLVAGDIAAQTEQSFKNLFNVLRSAGLTSDDVIKVNVFLTDMRNFQAMNAVYAKQFTAPYPARTTIGVKELPLGADIEIEMIARKA